MLAGQSLGLLIPSKFEFVCMVMSNNFYQRAIIEFVSL